MAKLMYKIGIECESIEDQTWGIGRIVNKLLENLANRPELASEFKFFLYFKSRIPDLPYLQSPLFVKKIVRLPPVPSSFSLYYYVLLPIKLWFEGLDLMFFPSYMLPIIFRGKSLVMLTEDLYYEARSNALPFRYKLAYRVFGNWAAKHATRIMAISESSKKEVARLFKIAANKIVVNQLGVEAPKHPESKPKGNYILYVGQVFPRRHLKETMLAFEEIAPKFAGLKLIAIGKDKYNPPIIENLKNEINRRLGKEAIVYKEYVPEKELAELYSGAQLLVYISSKEAFGLPPLEALAYGIPPVVADEPINREIYGDKAFFVKNSGDTKSIAMTLSAALGDHTKQKEITNSADRTLARYNWLTHTDRFLEIVRKVASNV